MEHSGPGHLSEARLAIVCPMANEEDNAVDFVKAMLDATKNFKDTIFLAVLDHASTDNTRELLTRFAASEPRLQVIWAPENRCVVDAYVTGYRAALATGPDWVLEIDAGFSHQPADLQHFLQAMENDYECIFGSRFCQGGKIIEGKLVSRIISRGGSLVSSLLLGTPLADMTSGYQMFRPHVLQAVLDRGIRSRGPFFQTEIKVYCRKRKVVEVPIQYRHTPSIPRPFAVRDALLQLSRLFARRLVGRL